MNASIYVGTYAKYNNGSLKGEWLDLDDYDTKEDFYTACKELHKDEDDPELMFQDYEGIPEQFISESGIADEWFKYQEAITNSPYDAGVFEAAADLDISHDMVEELYQGEYSSDISFAQQLADDIGAINESASWPMDCNDRERDARDLMFDYSESNGHYFRTSY